MHTSHRVERLLTILPRGRTWIQVHLPARRRTRPVLFQRAGRRNDRDAAALALLLLLVFGLAVTAVWMAREIGRATAIAAVCDGDCTAPPGGVAWPGR
jgi:hypothetical protein